MNKSRMILYSFLGLSIIVKILDSVAHFLTGEFNFDMIGYAIYSLCIIFALVFAMIEEKYLAAVFISILKVSIIVAGPLLGEFFETITLNPLQVVNGVLGIVLLFVGFFLVFDFFRTHHYRTEAPSFVGILGPFSVLLFFSIFEHYEMGVLVALTEIIALILVAHVSEDLLWVGSFIVVPFNFIQNLTSDEVLSFERIMYWGIGSIILILALMSLVFNIKHFIHEQKEYKRQIEELHLRLKERRQQRQGIENNS